MARDEEKRRAWNRNKKAEDPDYWRRANYKIRFGITIEQYDQMLEKQNGNCAICETHSSEFKKRLFVDHCHRSGKVRGLLCSNCNSGIGKLQDSPQVLETAMYYVMKHAPTGRVKNVPEISE